MTVPWRSEPTRTAPDTDRTETEPSTESAPTSPETVCTVRSPPTRGRRTSPLTVVTLASPASEPLTPDGAGGGLGVELGEGAVERRVARGVTMSMRGGAECDPHAQPPFERPNRLTSLFARARPQPVTDELDLGGLDQLL